MFIVSTLFRHISGRGFPFLFFSRPKNEIRLFAASNRLLHLTPQKQAFLSSGRFDFESAVIACNDEEFECSFYSSSVKN